ncbi:MAG: sulfatase-like hydrolase/transferase, partial [Planctomycetaceae bacterium]|nr:sulfatase-like hydrolase/transferase [Planctomycetaceae bacterium]
MILRFIPFCCLLLSTLATTLCSAAKSNVLFIAIDDLRADLACYGNPQIISPNIDALATSGTLFNRAYCQQAVCNPSRSSMLTGLRLDDLKIWDLPTHFRQRRPNAITLPQMFLNNGYHTQCIGKIFHNWR